MTRLLHTADTHIGYRQYNAPERRRDFLSAFREVIEDAVAADVDAVVHAGDLFHDRRPGLRDLQGTIAALRRLADADVPFLAVVGNHEGKRDAQWLDLFADLGLATRLGDEPVLVGDVALYGLDFVPRSRREGLEYAFAPVPDDAEAAVLVSHGLFEPFAHADWETERLLKDASVEFDALLVGDNHAPGTAEVAGTWITYPGSTERASASEREARGYNVVAFDDEVAISRRTLEGCREFVFVDVELQSGEGVERVRERVREHELADAVVIVTVEGEGEPIAPASVEELAVDRGALLARVNDRRELAETEAEPSVSFADPDEAVRERLRELGLSEVARGIDGTVRDDAIADANVRGTVERRVRELLEGEPSAFEPAADGERSADAAGEAEAGDEGGEAEAGDEETEAGDGLAETADGDREAETVDADGPTDEDGDGLTGEDGQLSLGDLT